MPLLHQTAFLAVKSMLHGKVGSTTIAYGRKTRGCGVITESELITELRRGQIEAFRGKRLDC